MHWQCGAFLNVIVLCIVYIEFELPRGHLDCLKCVAKFESTSTAAMQVDRMQVRFRITDHARLRVTREDKLKTSTQGVVKK
jgi:hypothetical protein